MKVSEEDKGRQVYADSGESQKRTSKIQQVCLLASRSHFPPAYVFCMIVSLHLHMLSVVHLDHRFFLGQELCICNRFCAFNEALRFYCNTEVMIISSQCSSAQWARSTYFYSIFYCTSLLLGYLKKKISITIAYFWKIHQIGIVQKDYKK